MGRGACLFEGKRKLNILAPSVLGPNLSSVLGLVCFENFQSLIKTRVRVRVRDPRPTHPCRLDTLFSGNRTSNRKVVGSAPTKEHSNFSEYRYPRVDID